MDFKNIIWNENNYQKYIEYLKSLSETKYKEFNNRLVTTKYEMLGIRLPILRKIAGEIFKGNYEAFLNICKNTYYEEILIKGLVIGKIKDIDELMLYFDDYILLIDNWAINDSFCNSLKIVNKDPDCFFNIVKRLIKGSYEYQVRVGLIILLSFYVKEEYIEEIFKILDSINSDLYYINMAEAWLICEIFTKYPENTIKYFENNNLNKFTINKAISKIRDSFRVSKEKKDYILKYKC